MEIVSNAPKDDSGWWPVLSKLIEWKLRKHREHSSDIGWVQLRDDLWVHIAVSDDGQWGGSKKHFGVYNISLDEDRFRDDDAYCQDELQLRTMLWHASQHWRAL